KDSERLRLPCRCRENLMLTVSTIPFITRVSDKKCSCVICRVWVRMNEKHSHRVQLALRWLVRVEVVSVDRKKADGDRVVSVYFPPGCIVAVIDCSMKTLPPIVISIAALSPPVNGLI